ncbi:MAG: hypothetical protein ACE14T_12170, partial [Syntrophales bacterium]
VYHYPMPTIDEKIKIRAIRKGMTLTDIAKKIKTESGQIISQQKFCDMLKGRRPGYWKKYKGQVAEILGLKRL